ncbi:hypothetical protein MNBD_UNCLBAC01-1203 [hydrothermal vent metagenome]|uniref:Uncharacterized protein n=1 Tax=hydrothermal vent metagenome TaxID=652676 RepID=A0A3B1DNX0_9ZZZZ
MLYLISRIWIIISGLIWICWGFYQFSFSFLHSQKFWHILSFLYGVVGFGLIVSSIILMFLMNWARKLAIWIYFSTLALVVLKLCISVNWSYQPFMQLFYLGIYIVFYSFFGIPVWILTHKKIRILFK